MGGNCSGCGGSAGNHIGNTLNTAIVLGEPELDVYRVQVTGSVAGLNQGAVKYVRGSNVMALVESNDLRLLAGGPRRLASPRRGTTLYYVDGIGYTDMGAARVRSGQTGEDIVVRTIG